MKNSKIAKNSKIKYRKNKTKKKLYKKRGGREGMCSCACRNNQTGSKPSPPNIIDLNNAISKQLNSDFLNANIRTQIKKEAQDIAKVTAELYTELRLIRQTGNPNEVMKLWDKTPTEWKDLLYSFMNSEEKLVIPERLVETMSPP